MIEDLGTNILTVSPGGGSSSRDRVFRRDILTAQIVNSIEENISGLD
ncbi:MAG: hypothetical protein LBF15_03450 [Candidatus Peribacteria bacterium]|jgi:hypothetical protein|nr:hypothetical protein [Candidatus Peribacteria bacterium]